MSGWFGSDYDKGKEAGDADRERIDSSGYGILDAIEDTVRDLSIIRSPDGSFEKGYSNGRSGEK